MKDNIIAFRQQITKIVTERANKECIDLNKLTHQELSEYAMKAIRDNF